MNGRIERVYGTLEQSLGIVFFQAARAALRQARVEGRNGYMHEALPEADSFDGNGDVEGAEDKNA